MKQTSFYWVNDGDEWNKKTNPNFTETQIDLGLFWMVSEWWRQSSQGMEGRLWSHRIHRRILTTRTHHVTIEEGKVRIELLKEEIEENRALFVVLVELLILWFGNLGLGEDVVEDNITNSVRQSNVKSISSVAKTRTFIFKSTGSILIEHKFLISKINETTSFHSFVFNQTKRWNDVVFFNTQN